MTNAYYPPEHGKQNFHCVRCGVYAAQTWCRLVATTDKGAKLSPDELTLSLCAHCDQFGYWYKEKLALPATVPVTHPHPDLPEACVQEYEEARKVFNDSPRSAAALLRLTIEKLLPHLGQEGRTINDAIKALVADGLPVRVQQALDYCRVVGNDAVHLRIPAKSSTESGGMRPLSPEEIVR